MPAAPPAFGLVFACDKTPHCETQRLTPLALRQLWHARVPVSRQIQARLHDVSQERTGREAAEREWAQEKAVREGVEERLRDATAARQRVERSRLHLLFNSAGTQKSGYPLSWL